MQLKDNCNTHGAVALRQPFFYGSMLEVKHGRKSFEKKDTKEKNSGKSGINRIVSNIVSSMQNTGRERNGGEGKCDGSGSSKRDK